MKQKYPYTLTTYNADYEVIEKKDYVGEYISSRGYRQMQQKITHRMLAILKDKSVREVSCTWDDKSKI